MRNQDAPVVDDLKSILMFFNALGIDGLPVQFSENRPDNAFSSTAKQERLALLRKDLKDCNKCKLSKNRKNIVFGEGSPDAKIMFIGEAPGKEEDIQGLPFVGDAGILLTRLIEKMGFTRKDVFIANIIKCRPPLNRDPEPDEVESCFGYLKKQIEIIMPEIIITLGSVALRSLMHDPELKITAARGNFLEYGQIPVMPTFHPAYLLRNPKDKWLTWSDVQKAMERIKR